MPRNVVAILPGDKLDHVTVKEDLKSLSFTGDKGAILSLPVEEYELDGEKYYFVRYSANVTEHEVEKAIRHFND